MFLRSKRFLAHKIHRIKIKGTGARKPSSPETEPNFYAFPFLPAETNDAGAKALGAAAAGAGVHFPYVPRVNPPGPMGLSALPLGMSGMHGASHGLPPQLLPSFSGNTSMPPPMLGQDLFLANLQRERLKQVLMATHGLTPDAAAGMAASSYPQPGTASDPNAAALAALQQQHGQQQARGPVGAPPNIGSGQFPGMGPPQW